jgi:hypothetical protein
VSTTTDAEGEASGDQRLALLLAMGMFVPVVDTSLMNVSISAVVEDIGTTVSGVQSAIAPSCVSDRAGRSGPRPGARPPP